MTGYKAMTSWLAKAPRPLVLGADLNTWSDNAELVEADRSDPYFEELEFVGLNPRHGLVDAYREALASKGQLDRLRKKSPEGPLAVSHILRGGARHRMDRIYVSPDFTAADGNYLYDEAKRAGSDHALHWVELKASGSSR